MGDMSTLMVLIGIALVCVGLVVLVKYIIEL
jgi:LPXTG-motif cell wall-anchored protein